MSKEKEPAPAPAAAAPAASVADGATPKGAKAAPKKKAAAKKAPATKTAKAEAPAAPAKKTARAAKAKEAPAKAKAPKADAVKAESVKADQSKADTTKGEAPKAATKKTAAKLGAPKAARPRKAAAKAETASAPAPTPPAPQQAPEAAAPRPQAAPAPSAAPTQAAPAPQTAAPAPAAAPSAPAAPAASAPALDGRPSGGQTAPETASGEGQGRKKRRRRHKNRHAQNAQNGAPATNGANGQNAPSAQQTAAPARPAPLPGNGPASYGAVIAAASAEHAAHDSSAPADAAANGEGQGRKKRRRRRRRNKHGNGDNAAPDAQNAQNATGAPAPEGAAPVPTAPAAASAPALDARPAGGQSPAPAPTAPRPARVPTGRRMLINVVDAGQARVAIVGRDGLEDIHIEKDGGRFVHGNIFKGRVDGVQPNLQAAFINIGGEKNAFLHVGDVVPPFGGYEEILGRRRLKAPSDTRDMRIEDMLVEGQEVLVQITREALVTKGPSVTTFLSIPGRYLVAMPNSDVRGVSKKITDDKERRELKKALEKLSPPKDMGYIIRTAGMGKGAEELQLDLDALNRMWQSIAELAKKAKAPAVLYQENDLVIRTIRDNFRADIDEVFIDSAADHARALEFANLMMPDLAPRVKLYDRPTPMFHAFGIEEKISNLFNRSVKLKSGGEILLEQTEAMVTIDVNTGKMGQAESTREMILQANLEAAAAIAREIRLRDLGGLVMIDFIDMDNAEDRKAVETALRRATRGDPSRITILPISQLGVLEMTRQRLRQSLHHTHYRTCPYCSGAGMYKRPESLGVEFMRRLRTELEKKNVRKVTATFNPHMAFDMANEFRAQLAAIEAEYHKAVVLAADPSYALDRYTLTDSQ